MKDVEYINSFVGVDNSFLSEMTDQDKTYADVSSFIENETGRFIGFLIRSTNAKSVLEIGGCIGYSSIWLAESLRTTKGRLTTLEYNDKLVPEFKNNVKKAGVEDLIDLLHEDAITAMPKFKDNSFDIVFQDSRKSMYTDMFEDCIRVVKKGGIIIADDTLFTPRNVPEKFSKHTDRYNQIVFKDKRLYSSIVNIGEGLTLSVKL